MHMTFIPMGVYLTYLHYTYMGIGCQEAIIKGSKEQGSFLHTKKPALNGLTLDISI